MEECSVSKLTTYTNDQAPTAMAYSSYELFSTVTEALSQRNVDYLKKLLNLLPVSQKLTRKDDLVKEIATHLQGKKLRVLWESLDPLQQAAVAEATYSIDGQFQALPFEAKYGSQPHWGERKYGYFHSPSSLGLFFYTSNRYSSEPGVTLPGDLQMELQKFVPQPEKVTLKTTSVKPTHWAMDRILYDYQSRTEQIITDYLPITHVETERAAHQDLLAVLRLINLGKVAVSDKTYLPSAATIKAISPHLQGGDYYDEFVPTEDWQEDHPIGPIKSLAWPLIAQATGLASLSGKKLELTPAGQKALGTDPAKTLQTIWKKWLKTQQFDELRRIDQIKGQTGKGKRGLTPPANRRSVILATLQGCPVMEWIDVSDFRRYMIATNQTFVVSRNPENLYFLESGYGDLYNAGADWSILQSCYLRCFLFEYAATLGLIDVGYVSPFDGEVEEVNDYWGADTLAFVSRYDGLVCFRVNALGAYCLGLVPHYTPTAVAVESTLRVLPNLDVIVTGQPLTSAETLVLELYAKQESDAVWKLNREQALSSLASGHSLQDLQQFLEKGSPDPLPNTVEQFIADLETRSQSLVDQGTARLIECNDPMLATLIANDSRTKKFCFLAGERHLVVPTEGETRFRNALRKLGYSISLP